MYPNPPLRPLSVLLQAGILLACSGTALGKECWVDIYDKPNFEGNHARIEGPAALPDLKSVNNEDWNNRIESLRVGADAEVVAFRRAGFDEKVEGPVNHPEAFQSWGTKDLPAYRELEITFGAGKEEHHLGELHFHQNINALKVRCRQ